MEHLIERGIRVHVLTSGNGLTYFSSHTELASLTPMEAFGYSGKDGRVSGWRTFCALHTLYSQATAKRRQLDRLLEHVPIDLAVTDSEYTTSPLRRRGIPVIGLNNADVVVSEYLKGPRMPSDIRGHFWLVEYADYLFHRTFCDLVISPSLVSSPPRYPRIHRVGPIVRRSVLEAGYARRESVGTPGNVKSLVFMLSGSVFASKIALNGEDYPFHIDVIGRAGESTGKVTFHGRIMDNSRFLQKADALVINGGFSAVSEAVVLNKPTFVIPVPGHAEQHLNARALRDMGYGYVVREGEVMDKLKELYQANQWTGMQPKAPIAGADGARQAADIIAAALLRRQEGKRLVWPRAVTPLSTLERLVSDQGRQVLP